MPTAHRSASGSSAIAISASTSAASASSASVAPGSSGLGKLTVGKSGSGANWLATVCTSIEAGAPQRFERHRAAHPVQRGQRHPNRTRRRAPHPGGPLDVVLDQPGVGGFDGRPGDLVGERGVGDGGFDLAVGGGDDLDSAVEVHLVAVVGRRVVRCGDLDSGRRAGVPDRKSQHRRGYRIWQQRDRKSLGGKHFSGRRGELRPTRAGRRGRRSPSSRPVRDRRAPAPPPSWRATPRRGSSRPGRRAPARAARRCRMSAGGRTAPPARPRSHAASSAAVTGSGSWAIQSSGVTPDPLEPCDHVGQQRTHPGRRRGAGRRAPRRGSAARR